jgi:hypothetical protein
MHTSIHQSHRRRRRLRRAKQRRALHGPPRPHPQPCALRFQPARSGTRARSLRSERACMPRTTEKRWHGHSAGVQYSTVQAMWSARARWMCPCQWPVALSAGTAALNWRLALGTSRQAFNFGNVPAGARRLATRTPAVRTCHYYSTSTWLPDRKSDDTNSQMSRQT